MSAQKQISLELPAIEVRPLPSLACAYGADHVAARYCGLAQAPAAPPGIWQHGWIAHYRSIDPAAVIGGYGCYDSVKEKEAFWVAREDQEEYLRDNGYRKAKAIGLPIVYLPQENIARIPGTLLVMPVHSLEYTKHNWNFEAYAEEIAKIQRQFVSVVACVHSSCWKRGYWVDAFRTRGIPVIQGAQGDDRNALLRLQVLFSTFECVTTNGYGSHLAYAAYLGAKVSIYGPYAEYRKGDYANTALYQTCPHILEPALEAHSEAAVRHRYPFFFCDPNHAIVKEDWGAEEVGVRCRVAPDELRRLFNWTFPHRAANKLGRPLKRFRQQSRRIVGHAARSLVSAEYRRKTSEFSELRHVPPNTPGKTLVYGKAFRFLDRYSFLFLYDEIVRRGIYRFSTNDAHPLVIDCGANIGMSVVYFKHQHPNARILAFEPDPEVFAVLSANCREFGLTDVKLHQEAIWTESSALSFRRESSTLGGRLENRHTDRDGVTVRTQRLRDLLNQKVAMLKIDIEGAETDVLEDSADVLGNVDHMFVEYHSFADRPQSLHRLLTIIHDAGFRVYFHVYEPSPQPLFLRTIRSGIDLLDMNVDIFCYRS